MIKHNDGISENRIKHCLGVARKAEELARLMDWDVVKCREMFVLGLLHDIGYEHVTDNDDHAFLGGTQLKKSGYKYWREVYWHGKLVVPYSSDELSILNLADLRTDTLGNPVTIEERLLDVKERYGSSSKRYKNAVALAGSYK